MPSIFHACVKYGNFSWIHARWEFLASTLRSTVSLVYRSYEFLSPQVVVYAWVLEDVPLGCYLQLVYVNWCGSIFSLLEERSLASFFSSITFFSINDSVFYFILFKNISQQRYCTGHSNAFSITKK